MTYDLLDPMLSRVDDATAANPGARTATFLYGPDRKRYKRIDKTVADGTTNTSYLHHIKQVKSQTHAKNLNKNSQQQRVKSIRDYHRAVG